MAQTTERRNDKKGQLRVELTGPQKALGELMKNRREAFLAAATLAVNELNPQDHTREFFVRGMDRHDEIVIWGREEEKPDDSVEKTFIKYGMEIAEWMFNSSGEDGVCILLREAMR